ncbi:MAG: hypothetical protein CMH74_01270 [Nitrospina sp.]|nr:hypothetical protein [Nitrospina sp.]
MSGENETWDGYEKELSSCYFSTLMPRLLGLFRSHHYLWTNQLADPEPDSELEGMSPKQGKNASKT